MGRILLTGGVGFIGSHLAERLLVQGHELTILDSLSSFYSPEIKLLNLAAIQACGSFRFVQGDIRQPAVLEQVFEQSKPEVVIHLAAQPNVRYSVAHPAEVYDVNLTGTLRLVEMCKEVPPRQFIFGSSSTVYGPSQPLPFAEDAGACSPVSAYGTSKLAAEAICRSYGQLAGFSVICLRLFSVHGPRQRPDLAIHKFTRLIEEDRELPIFGDGSAQRDYTYIDDILDGVGATLELDRAFEIINLGNSIAISVNELISILERKLGVPARREQLEAQRGEMPITCADISKARRLLGYAPRIGLEEGIERFLAWYRQVRKQLAAAQAATPS